MKIQIIGGGIGGLVAGISLLQNGFDVEVFEATPKLQALGSGIVIAANAINIFERLGMLSKIEAKSFHLKKSAITDKHLKTIQAVGGGSFSLTIHRAELHQILLEHFDATRFHLGKRFQHYQKENDKLKTHFEDGTSFESDVLIAADGIHSAVRKQLFPNRACRHSGQVCWRAVVDFEFPDSYEHNLAEMWGGKARFGIVPLSEGRVYWFAVWKGDKAKFDDSNKINSLLELYKDFDPIVSQLISRANPDKIHFDDLMDINPTKENWYEENICLIGDAAHATTPNLGQGACQAIEDGYSIAVAMKNAALPQEAFQRFQNARKKKVNFIVKNSWQFGHMAHWESSLATGLRNRLFRMIPPSIAEKQIGDIFDMSYIDKI